MGSWITAPVSPSRDDGQDMEPLADTATARRWQSAESRRHCNAPVTPDTGAASYFRLLGRLKRLPVGRASGYQHAQAHAHVDVRPIPPLAAAHAAWAVLSSCSRSSGAGLI